MTRRRTVSFCRDESGTTLVELVAALSALILVVGATMAFLEASTRGQRRDQAFGQEITAAQTSLARFTHDLRAATKILVATPDVVEFLVRDSSGTLTTVRYDCNAPDSLGGTFRRCARVSALWPQPLPAPAATATSLDVQHVENGGVATYCNAAGTARSGSVFFYQDPSFPDPNVAPPPCDEIYQDSVAALAPPYLQVQVKLPASGDLSSGGLTHTTTFSTAVYLRNQDSGA